MKNKDLVNILLKMDPELEIFHCSEYGLYNFCVVEILQISEAIERFHIETEDFENDSEFIIALIER